MLQPGSPKAGLPKQDLAKNSHKVSNQPPSGDLPPGFHLHPKSNTPHSTKQRPSTEGLLKSAPGIQVLSTTTVFSNLVSEAPRPAHFSVWPASNTSDLTYQLITKPPQSSRGCIKAGNSLKCAGQGASRTRVENTEPSVTTHSKTGIWILGGQIQFFVE